VIPRILHQTWKDARVPERWRGARASWRAHHPGWEHRFWTDADLRALVARHDPDFLPVYDAYRDDISRVDAARYRILAVHGGVYVDLDFECLRPLDAWLDGRALVMGLEPEAHLEIPLVRRRGLERIVGNAFLASAPGHPFWAHLRHALLEHRDEPDPLDAAGPFLLTDAVASWPGPEPVTLAPARTLYPLSKEEVRAGALDPPGARERLARDAFAVHHWAGTWVPRYQADAPSRGPRGTPASSRAAGPQA